MLSVNQMNELTWSGLVSASANMGSVGQYQIYLTRCNPILYEEVLNVDMACSFAARASAKL